MSVAMTEGPNVHCAWILSGERLCPMSVELFCFSYCFRTNYLKILLKTKKNNLVLVKLYISNFYGHKAFLVPVS